MIGADAKKALAAVLGFVVFTALFRRERPSHPHPAVARAKRNRNRILKAIQENREETARIRARGLNGRRR